MNARGVMGSCRTCVRAMVSVPQQHTGTSHKQRVSVCPLMRFSVTVDPCVERCHSRSYDSMGGWRYQKLQSQSWSQRCIRRFASVQQPERWHGMRMNDTYMRTIVTRVSNVEDTESGASSSKVDKKKVVFLGTPEVAASVLKRLVDASKADDSSFEIIGVVTQPGRPRGRRSKGLPVPSPVQTCAQEECHIPEERIYSPVKATEKEFLDILRDLRPDLCITAAYGNYLPTAFLKIPVFGTLNIHPSLLPAYRGAAPVQRSLQDGLEVTGVTVLYTVKEMDAGPILAQQRYTVSEDIQAPEMLEELFQLGTNVLLEVLPQVWTGEAEMRAWPQNLNGVSHAPKLLREEGELDFLDSAVNCHNKVRAFAGWPGTYHTFELIKDGTEAVEYVEIKIIKTRVREDASKSSTPPVDPRTVVRTKDALEIVCGDGHVLQILELQTPGKKAAKAQAFINGLVGKTLKFSVNQKNKSK